jgi:hypothetical protein
MMVIAAITPPYYLVLLLLLFSQFHALLLADDAVPIFITDEEEEKLDFGLVAWVRTMMNSSSMMESDGYFNPKQDIRREFPKDANSIVGVFAREQISQGELLLRVPWEAIIMPEDDYEPVNDEELEEGSGVDCATARKLAKEMTLGKDSRYAPYVLYLLNQAPGQLPSAWSVEGRQLLQTVLGGTPSTPRIPPVHALSWLDEDWFENCSGDKDDVLGARAAMLVVQRADDELMVPSTFSECLCCVTPQLSALFLPYFFASTCFSTLSRYDTSL